MTIGPFVGNCPVIESRVPILAAKPEKRSAFIDHHSSLHLALTVRRSLASNSLGKGF